MSIITLTTDLGLNDHYVASVKANILRQIPEAKIVDITHLVSPFNISHAGYVVKNCYKEFPPKSIHIIGVETELKEKTCHLAVYADNHYFIGAENGIFSLILDVKPDEIVELNIDQDSDSITFPTKNIFTKAACHIYRGGKLNLIGKPKNNFSIEKSIFHASFDQNTIRGSVIHIDSYGNALTNINKELFNKIRKERNFSINLGSKGHYKISEINTNYSLVAQGEVVALFISNNQLEIAINKGSAKNLMGLSVNDIVRIEFYD